MKNVIHKVASKIVVAVVNKVPGISERLNYEKYPDVFLIQLQRFYLEKIFLPYGKGVSYDYRWTLQPEKMGDFELVYPPEKDIQKFLQDLNIVLRNEKELLKLYKELQEMTKSRIISIMSNSFNYEK